MEEKESLGFNYQDKSVPKLTEEFKHKFSNNIKGKESIQVAGLTAFAHEKGIWKMETRILQYPSAENKWTAICETVVGGYDWDPIKKEVREVIYSDIGDANEQNCGKQVAASYIRMASTRSQGRALRKYTNIDIVCSEEMGNITNEPQEKLITTEQLTEIKSIIQSKQMSQEEFGKILFGLFQHTNYAGLTVEQGHILESTLRAYVRPQQT